MKASELRIGNIVEWWSDGNRKMWMEVSPPGINSLSKGRVDYRPIPLTEEWLLKFGFKIYDLFTSKIFRDGSVVFVAIDSEEIKVGVKMSDGEAFIPIRSLKYVHEFQNFYLANAEIELIIK